MEIEGLSIVSVLIAALAGLVSFLSPCVLPLVPGYLSAVSGVSPSQLEDADWRRVLVPSLLFIASFSLIFILLGLTATAIGELLREEGETLEKIAGISIVLMGVLFVATVLVPRLNREWRLESLLERAGRGGPLVAGAAFGLAWTPCIGPALSSILILAGTEGTVLEGGILLLFYSAGLAIPFLLTAIAFSRMTTAFGFVKRHYGVIVGFGGVTLILMGILVFTGELTRLNGEAQGLLDDLGINIFQEV
jgi:cytochrome c-type biogenesis protein